MSESAALPSPRDLLVELSRLMVGIAYRSLDGLAPGLDLLAFRALAFVERHPESTMGALALGVDLPPATATRLCDRLEAAGWLIRQHKPHNRRQVEVVLTRKGHELVCAAVEARARELEAVLDRLTKAQRETLDAVLPDLVTAAAVRSQDDVPAWSV